MSKLQRCGMQEKSVQPRIRQLLIELTVTVAIVKSNWMTGILGMHTDLVRTAGHRATAHKGGKCIALFHFKTCF